MNHSDLYQIRMIQCIYKKVIGFLFGKPDYCLYLCTRKLRDADSS